MLDFLEEFHELFGVVSDEIVAVINNDDKVGGFVLFYEIVDLLFVLELQFKHVDNRFFALFQIYIQFLAEDASVHRII